MRNWLLRLLGAPRPIVIEPDEAVIAPAGPGDLVILRYNDRMTLSLRKELGEFLGTIHKRHPGVRFMLLDSAFAPVVVAKGARS